MTDYSPRSYLLKGLLVLGLGLGGFAAWALVTEIHGAVLAPGEVAVEARRQAIQHPDGGLVAALHVKEAQAVAAGTPILTLDGTELAAQRVLTLRERAETLARIDRLLAEVRNGQSVTYRPELAAKAGKMADEIESLPHILSEETSLFEARRATLEQTTAQLTERTVQTGALIGGRSLQLTATREQLALIREELDAQEDLLGKGLTQKTRVLALRREAAQLSGQVGELEASIAEARSSIAGFKVERLRLEAEFREEAQAELRTLQPKEAELGERLRVIETQLRRLVLRAPMAGTVLGLQANTVNGVIPAGQEIAAIVPRDTPLVLMVEIDPRQIDRVHQGQPARIRFPNFDQRTTPEVDGTVLSVSADAITEPTTGRRFFRAELTLAPGAAGRLNNQILHPGMPVEALIQTDTRSPASFLVKPLADYLAYAMREE
jgi:HlyD family secretion protein